MERVFAMAKSQVLLVEDEQITAMDLQEMIEEAGYRVKALVDTAESALETLENGPVDLVVMDIRLPGERDGIEATQEINDRFGVPVVYLTALSDEETLERARSTEPAGFLVKPVTMADLNATLKIVLGNGES